MSGETRRLYICESPNCPGDGENRQREVGPITHFQYGLRTSFGRLLYCDLCEASEPPRRMMGAGSMHTIPASWLGWW